MNPSEIDMKINTDSRLSAFGHFGGSWENENNTTRAFLMALSRSPWSLALFRAFMDLVRDKLRTQSTESDAKALADDLLSRSPDEIDIRMQRDASAHDFRLQKDEVGVLVVLTPVVRNREGLTPQPNSSNAGGIVDAWIRATYGEDRGLIIVIENKLYGDADQQQRQKYLAGLGSNSVELDLSWEDVCLLLEFLPEAARSDVIIGDFKDFMDRDPRLVGFTGFHRGDSGNPKRLLETLRRLHQRIARETLDMGGQPLFEGIPKRDSEPDFNMRLRQPSNLPGNVGLIYREGERLSAKLVIGSRVSEFDIAKRHLQTRRVLDALSDLDLSRVQFLVSVRLRPANAVQMRGVIYAAESIWNGPGNSIADRWREIVTLSQTM
jgi:hypothetical protein